MKGKLIGCLNRSVPLTYVGVAWALGGIWQLLLISDTESVNRVDAAVICLIAAGICDLFDGVIARRCRRNETQKKFGVQIDSLADVVSFLIFPAALLCAVCRNRAGIVYPVAAFYVLSGINRLAWFNIHAETFENVFRGLPVTYAALIIPVFYVFFCADHAAMRMAMPVVYAALGILFSLNIRIPKPKAALYPVFAVIAAVLVILILF